MSKITFASEADLDQTLSNELKALEELIQSTNSADLAKKLSAVLKNNNQEPNEEDKSKANTVFSKLSEASQGKLKTLVNQLDHKPTWMERISDQIQGFVGWLMGTKKIEDEQIKKMANGFKQIADLEKQREPLKAQDKIKALEAQVAALEKQNQELIAKNQTFEKAPALGNPPSLGGGNIPKAPTLNPPSLGGGNIPKAPALGNPPSLGGKKSQDQVQASGAEGTNIKQTMEKIKKDLPPQNTRDAMLDQIKGGVKLKPAKKTEPEPKQEEQKQGMGLNAQLLKAVAERRKQMEKKVIQARDTDSSDSDWSDDEDKKPSNKNVKPTEINPKVSIPQNVINEAKELGNDIQSQQSQDPKQLSMQERIARFNNKGGGIGK